MKSDSLRLAAVGLVAVLSGCATFDARRGLSEAGELAAARGRVVQATATAADCRSVHAALAIDAAQPVTLDHVVQVALACNPALAAQYARLGIANADAFEAGRLANPTLSLGVADSNADGGGTKLSLGIAQNFTNLILRGPRTRLAEGEFLRAQQLLAGSVLELAADLKGAWFEWIGAHQVADARVAIAEAAAAAAELAGRFHAAGNMPARELARIDAEAVEARIAERAARRHVVHARIAVQRLLGVAGFEQVPAPEAIGEPLPAEEALADLRARADAQRLDLAATRGLVGLLADSAATTKRLRWLGEFEVGIDYEREPDHSRLLGPTLSIQLPLFQQGQGVLARAQSAQAWSEAERRRLTLEVATAVELAHEQVAAARARVEDHRLRLLPQRAEVVARTQEEVNYMLRGVFELIDARIAEYEAAQGYFEALADYWIARSRLERAVGAELGASATATVRAADVLDAGAARAGDDAHDHGTMDHSKMDHSKMDHSKMDHSKMDHSKMDHARQPAPAATPPKPAHRHDGHDHDNGNRGEQP